MANLHPSDYQELTRLLNRSHLSGSEKQRAWVILKETGLTDAQAYVADIENAYLVEFGATMLRESPVSYRVWGAEQIEEGALRQMELSARLPVAVAGALMPDAHLGYGLPIGGVLATDNVVIPYAVGVDIACRMMLTVYPIEAGILNNLSEFDNLRQIILANTTFRAGAVGLNDGKTDHPILDKHNWAATELLRNLRQTAIYQIGTSGGGNHFADVGIFTLGEGENDFGLGSGEYLALVTHSGSRGVGFKIANHYSQLAMAHMPNLDKSVKHLAWLSLGSGTGQEYWHAMELAGEFASANHHVIHERFAAALGVQPNLSIENHHNFAWRETIQVDGVSTEVVVHRKGATPAGKGVLGIIPGTMADKGYVVRGKGEPTSLQSASHGGGRVMSRTYAKANITPEAQAEYLAGRGVTLLGGGLDEAPQAYKQIENVIAAQMDLIEIIGTFQPRLVRMASDTLLSGVNVLPTGVVDAEGD